MSCENCAQQKADMDTMIATLDEIRTSQVQTQAKLDWVVETVNKLMEGFQGMMNAGGPLAMIKALRSKG